MDSAKYLLNSFLTMTIAKDMIIMIEQGKKINWYFFCYIIISHP